MFTDRRVLAAVLAVASLAAAGCGSGASGTSIDPARAVPASAPLYAGAFVRPTGSLKSSARAAATALTHQSDPYLRLLAALQTPGSSALDYGKDVAPWLGPRAGVFLTATGGSEERAVDRLVTLIEQGILGSSSGGAFPFAAHSVEGAIVLDTRDAAKARSFLGQLAARAGAHAVSYRGVSYEANAAGIAFGIVSRLAVIGTETGVRAVIDTTDGGPSLAAATTYAKLTSAAPAGALANVYANATAFGGSSAQASVSSFSLLAGGGYVNVSLVPSASSIAVDADALGTETGNVPGGLFASSSAAATALGELPGESWLAVGLGGVGHSLGADVGAIEGLVSVGGTLSGSGSAAPSAGISVKGLLGGILAPLRALGAENAKTKREFASWMGSAGLFASGTGLLELKGGVVIDSTDAARSRAAVAELGALLQSGGASVQSAKVPGTEAAVAVRLSGLPVALDVAAGKNAGGQARFVIGLGEQSVQDALSPSSTISGSAPYGTASAALGQGYRPSAIVDVPTLLGLLEGVGLSEDPSVAPFVPYLRSLSTVSAGGGSLGNGIERLRLVVGLQGAG
ncbi:MAG TPA: DUF3352 domain-containing protein [Solirubrobacteraceae bacterium]|jgi:hypothetical protein|nr:DUF3352 domain-containing protein [Solirubrobacteraceae bacterium]